MKNEYDVENYTLADWQALNERLEAVGLPKVIIKDGKVYKDDIHMLLGIGIEIAQ